MRMLRNVVYVGIVLLVVVLVWGMTKGALAQEVGAGADAEGDRAGVPAAIGKLREAGGQVVRLGEAEGLDGYLVRPPSGETYSAYVTATGALVVGMLLGPEGDNVTRRQLQEAGDAGKLDALGAPAGASPGPAPETPVQRMGRLLQATKEAPGFWLGDRGPVIHVFADATCPYSVRHVQALDVEARAGRLRAHVIPVGLLGDRAAKRAVEIAGAERPGAAWRGAASGAVDRDRGADRVAGNHRLHGGWGVSGVPFSVWEGPQGARVKYGAGEPAVYAGDVLR